MSIGLFLMMLLLFLVLFNVLFLIYSYILRLEFFKLGTTDAILVMTMQTGIVILSILLATVFAT